MNKEISGAFGFLIAQLCYQEVKGLFYSKELHPPLNGQHWLCASYVRLSKEDEDAGNGGKDESNSITNQKALIRDYLADHPDLELVGEFVDDGYSGVNFDRPDFKRMMEEVKNRRINCIIVKDLVKSGTVSSEILFMIYHHKLIGKAEKLYSQKLLPEYVLNVVHTKLITMDILPQLDNAILIKTAHYLYNHHEISRELLDRTIDGTIHPKFIRTIRRYYRQLQNSIEIEKTHAYYTPINDGQYFSSPDYFACPNPQIDKNILAETVHKYLYKAMAQLTSTERNLIRKIYVDQIHLRPLATVMGGNRRNHSLSERQNPEKTKIYFRKWYEYTF